MKEQKEWKVYCEEFRVEPDPEEKTIVVEAMRPRATLRLTKEGAILLAGFLLGQVKGW